ncbi:MAG: TonB-dependent receptor, partial [Bacteroidota bacterium]|nr:TonB-dependent receptor [Bacteroidota bacterium]
SDKFSVVTVDGNRMAPTDANERGVDLSTVSQGSLAGIELTKASTSDKDADAIAGSVNLVTKKAPSTRLIRIEPRGSYNALDKSAAQYNFSGRYGERFFDDLFGIQVSGNLERIIRSNESTDFNYDLTGINNGNDYEITSFRPLYTNEIRKRGGGSIILDFDTPDGGHLLFNSMLNQTSRNYLTSNRNYTQTGQVIYDYRDRETEITTINSFLHGENYLAGFKANWNLAFSQAKRNDPFDYELNLIEPSLRDSTGKTISGMGNVPKEYSKGPVEKWIPFALNNFQAATIDHANDNAQTNFDKEKSASLDLSKEYSLSDDLSGQIKFGGKFRQKSRYASFHQTRANYYLNTWPVWTKQEDGTIVRKNLSGTRFENLNLTQGGLVIFSNFLDPTPDNRAIYGKYSLYPLINRDALKLWRQLNINGYLDQTGNDPEYKNNVEVEGDGYSITERVLAGYAMNTLNVGAQISLLAGVRIESDDNDYSSKYTPKTLSGFPFPTGELRDTTVFHKESVVLPNVHAIIRPFDFMNVRLAGYKMLARPDFNQRLQKFIASSITGINTLTVGNPNLKNAVAWNYEIQTQFYGNAIGLFSVSAFYKDIKSMYHSTNGVQISGQRTLDSLGVPWKDPFANDDVKFNLNFPYNSLKPTHVWGFEVEHQMDFKFLPGYLSNIVLSYNLTIVRSETWVTSSKVVTDTIIQPPFPFPTPRTRIFLTETKQKLEDQPEFFGNASLGYDIDGFSFRVSVFHQSSYNATFSSNQRSDGVQDAYTRWDLAFKQKLTDFISVTLNLNNITNTQEGTTTADRFHSDWVLPNVNNRYGTTADLGIRVEL